MSLLDQFIFAEMPPLAEMPPHSSGDTNNTDAASPTGRGIEHWLHRSAWAVFKLPDEREALQCAEELSAHFPPGKVEAIGRSVQIDNRAKARS